MPEETFTIGADARCTDGVCGEVRRVVVDPVARAVTHLVIEPKHGHEPGRLVPLDLADATTGDVRLRCTMAEFGKLAPADETQFVLGSYPGYSPEQVLHRPHYGLAAQGVYDINRDRVSKIETYDSVPVGEVEVRRGDYVHATDGPIGIVEGLAIDPRSHQVTHVLLREGHLWGRKEVTIPIGAVTRVDNVSVRLSITKQQVEDLPPVHLDHRSGPADATTE